MTDIKRPSNRKNRLFTFKWEVWLSSLLAATTFGLHLLNLIFLPYLNHDASEYISIAQRIVNGAIPYVDIIDLNPPMIFYLSTIPVLISNATNIAIPITSLFFFFGLVLFSGYIFQKALEIASVQRFTNRDKYQLWAFWLVLSLWAYKTNNFSQREQLIFLFLAGFIVLRKARYDGKAISSPLAITCGVLAAIAFSIKPHYLLAVLAIELIFFASSSHRWKSIFVLEILIQAILGIAYLALFFVIPGAVRYLTYWIPVTSSGYSAYNTTWGTMFSTLFSDDIVYLSIVAILLILWRSLKLKDYRPLLLSIAFTIFGLVSLAIYFIQFKGWLYQAVGVFFGCLTGVFLLLRESGESFSKVRNPVFAAVIILNLALSVTTIYDEKGMARTPFQITVTDTQVVIEKLTSTDDGILLLSTNVPSVFPDMTYTGRTGVGHFLIAFPIAFFTNRSPNGEVLQEWKRDDATYFSGLLEDMTNEKPALVLVDISTAGDTYTYLSKKHFFEFVPSYKCIGYTSHLMVLLRQEKNESIAKTTIDTINKLYQEQTLIATSSCNLDNLVRSD